MKVAVLMSVSHGEIMDCEAVFASRELAEGFRRTEKGKKVPWDYYISEKEVVGTAEPKPEGHLRVRVIKEGFGYWDEHHVGEEFSMPIRHITECIQKGYIEIVVNNMGNNLPYDEPLPDSPFIAVELPMAEAPVWSDVREGEPIDFKNYVMGVPFEEDEDETEQA